MVARTSDTTSFNLDLNNIVEEAFERCGQELRTGYDLRTARRSLNLMTLEWANRGINLWTVEQGEVPLVVGTSTYDLPAETVDLLDHVIRTGSGENQSDISIARVSGSNYSTVSAKNATGRPVQVWINRRTGAVNSLDDTQYPQITVWPVPDSSAYTFVYWRMRRMQDMTGGTTGPDIPFRFLPALVAGLAYHLSLKIPGAIERTPLLKQQYDEAWMSAADEDREKAPLRLIPAFR